MAKDNQPTNPKGSVGKNVQGSQTPPKSIRQGTTTTNSTNNSGKKN